VNLDRFIEQRQPNWRQLESLLGRASRNMRDLSLGELDELGCLYRGATADLALAQRDFPNQKATIYLNQLVGRGHSLVYRSEPLGFRRLRSFYTTTYPQLYRVLLPYTSAAFVIFALGVLVAFLLVWRVPDTIYVFAGPGIAPLVEQVEQGDLWTDIAPTARSAAAGMILTNNIQVMFFTFAGGITAGLLSAWVLLNNGLGIGAVFGLLQVHNLAAGLAEFIVAHGVIELSVIFLAGGCGLYLGDGLIRPGLYGRRTVLVQRARVGAQLILGSVPLLVLAGLIEGFISPSSLPWWVKLFVGLASGVALYWYWLCVGRGGEVGE
jgi:uncharacterized membrane protein SpoIIM required for sporulation